MCGVEVWRAVMVVEVEVVVVGLTLRLQQQHQPVTVLGAVGGSSGGHHTPDTATRPVLSYSGRGPTA